MKMTKTVKEIVAEIKTKMDQAGGLKHVYFVACGGSKAAIYPGLYLLQSEAKTFGATTYTSNEFVHATPKELDSRCSRGGYNRNDRLYGDRNGENRPVCCYLFQWR